MLPVLSPSTKLALGSLVDRGAGLTYVPAAVVASKVAGRSLQRVLEDWTHIDPGFHIYYSSSRQLPVGSRLLIDLIRELESHGGFALKTPPSICTGRLNGNFKLSHVW